jgi:hypothetical protein
MSFSKRFCAKSPFNKNGKSDDKEKKKEKPYNWEPTLRKLDKDQVGNSGIYIT